MGKYHSKENYKDSVSLVFDVNNPLEKELFSLITLNSKTNQTIKTVPEKTKKSQQQTPDPISTNESKNEIQQENDSKISSNTTVTHKTQSDNLEAEKEKEKEKEKKVVIESKKAKKEFEYGIDFESEEEEEEEEEKKEKGNSNKNDRNKQAKRVTEEMNHVKDILVNKKYLESLKNLDEEQLKDLYQKLSVEDSEYKLILKENSLRNKNESSPSVIIPKYLIAFFNPFLYRVEERFTKSDFLLLKDTLQKSTDFIKSHLQDYHSTLLKDYKLFLCENENFVKEFIRTISFVNFDTILNETLITNKITEIIRGLETKSKWFEKDVIEELIPKFIKHFLYLILHLLVYNKDLEFIYFNEEEEIDEEKLTFFGEEEENSEEFVQIFPLITEMENTVQHAIAFRIDPDIEMDLNEDRQD
ncbi:peptidyl-prolyl cis-trans isomerase cyp63 [Anaeramoeba flamelloides]|uniref:Peptidyl-prolyl cis-trans isomerase cyp63 n=1 Tax=Anaeramoeba flamelloides TaxID=1746091 RepID=A0ABQ8Y839_9EUKA|nr:peptidyl-prolyl cis-trans isomerase cyp63 [Anaeramoeba flamelloides]